VSSRARRASARSYHRHVPGPEEQPLRQNRDFGVVLVSQGISALGDAVSFIALPLLVFALSGSGLVHVLNIFV